MAGIKIRGKTLTLKERRKVIENTPLAAIKKMIKAREQQEYKGRKTHVYDWQPDADKLQKIEQLSGLGLNQDQIAYMLNISPDTFIRKKKQHPEIATAQEIGRAKAITLVSNAFFNEATKGSFPHGRYYMANMQGWGDNVKSEITGANGGPIKTETFSSDEARIAKIASLLNAAGARGTRQPPVEEDGD